MPNLTQGQGTHSIPVFDNTIITFTGSVTAVFTSNSGVDIRNGVAVWTAITLPTIIRKRGYVRLTALSDSTYTVNTNPSKVDLDSFTASNGYLQYLNTLQTVNSNVKGIPAVGNGLLVDDTGKEIATGPNGLPLYYGAITGRSALPKSQGTWVWQYGEREFIINSRVNQIGIVYAFVSARGERMKATAEGTTNGFGQVYASLEVVNGDGTVYPAYLNGQRIGQCAYGDVMEMTVQLDRYLPVGTKVRVKNRVFQQAHNDATMANPNQLMLYFQYKRGIEYLGRANSSLSVSDQAAWAAMVDSSGSSNGTLSGATFGTIGFAPFNLVGYTSIPTWWVCGDSREQGSADDGSTSNVAYGLDDYGVSGQTCRRVGRLKHGVMNCAFISEQYADIQAVTNLFGRRKLELYCSHRNFEMGINDFGSGGDFNGVSEDSLVAAYRTSKSRVESLLLSGKKPTWVSTIYPSTTSTDFYITTTNQSVNQGVQLRTLNPAIRLGQVNNDGYFDGGSGIQTSIDSQIIKMPPNPRSVNTGTGTITVNAASGGNPAITTYVHSASIFTPDDNNRNIVIAAAGTGAAALKAQMKYVNATTVRLVQRGSNGMDFQIVAAQLNGGVSPLATTASTNILYIQAEQYVTGIHATFEGEEEMAQYDIRQGLVSV